MPTKMTALVFLASCATIVSAWQCLPNILPPKEATEVIRIPECMLNVRTVIFRELDTNKPCWTVSEVQLLVARRVMQGLVPTSIPRNFKMLYRFYEKAEHVLRSKLSGNRVKMYFQAYYDVIGGYIHSVVIPVLNEAYYAGNVDYETVKSFHGLMGRIMGFLDTNGDGWAGPCDMSRIPTKVIPLPLHICRVEESCNAFVVTPERRKDKLDQEKVFGEYHRYLRKMQKGSQSWNNYCSKGFSKIPLPFLDDPVYPGAIAIPLKDHALFSLMSERSVNVLPKYYILAMRCLASPQYTEMDMIRFNFFFHKWIMKDVVPHLYDLQRWYPGFGGVMRIVETMNIRGLASNELLPTTNKTPTCNKTMVHFKHVMAPGTDNTWIYVAIVTTTSNKLCWHYEFKKEGYTQRFPPPSKAIFLDFLYQFSIHQDVHITKTLYEVDHEKPVSYIDDIIDVGTALGFILLGLLAGLLWFFVFNKKQGEQAKKKKSSRKISVVSEKHEPSNITSKRKTKSTLETSKASSSKAASSKGSKSTGKTEESSESSGEESEEDNDDSMVVNTLVASLCNRNLNRLTPDRRSYSSLTASKGKGYTSMSGT